MDQVNHTSPQMSQLAENNVPSGLKIVDNTIKTSTFVQKEAILEVFEGQLTENSALNQPVEVLDVDQESKGWFEFDKYPNWFSLIKKSTENQYSNVYALYSNNHLSLRPKFSMEINTELVFDFRARFDDETYDTEAEMELYNEADLNCEASSEQESLK